MNNEKNVRDYNQKAWDKLAQDGIEWSIPVSTEVIASARTGNWQVFLTESKPVPRAWFPQDLHGVKILCLASGGGQQGPILAAAGAHVTSFDLSAEQLQRDRLVAEREGLNITTIQGDMRDLSIFPNEHFDLIFHPVSNIFIPEVLPVWHEAFRVLKHGGTLLAGMGNPVDYCFDPELGKNQGIYQVRFSLPYSDLTSITQEERERIFGKNQPLEFSHTLEEQIGGQIEAGFVIIGFYESYKANDPIANYMPSYIATRALKPKKKFPVLSVKDLPFAWGR
jgi:SAM-dependent methyltransferase